MKNIAKNYSYEKFFEFFTRPKDLDRSLCKKILSEKYSNLPIIFDDDILYSKLSKSSVHLIGDKFHVDM